MAMRGVLNLTLAAALAAMLALTAGTAMAELATIEGEATYRERIALRPGVVLEVELLDISRADAPSERLASIRIKDLSGRAVPDSPITTVQVGPGQCPRNWVPRSAGSG